MKSEVNYGYLTLITIVAALGGLLFGFDIAIITGANPSLKVFWDLSEMQIGLGTSALLFGCIPGAISAGYLTDIFGRKKLLIVVSLLFAVTCLLTALAPTFQFYVAARFFGGLAVGAASLVSPMYISEVSVSKIRGRLVSVYQLSIVTGILVSYFINYSLVGIPNDWRWMFATGLVPSVLFFFLLFIVPETPRFLYKIGKTDEAFNILKKIAGENTAQKEMAEIKASFNQVKVKMSELFKGGMLKAMLVGIGLAIFIQISGVNSIIDYAPFIFEKAGYDTKFALFATFGLGIVNFLFTWISIWVVDKFGRKPLYLIGSAGMTIALGVLAYLNWVGKGVGLPVIIICVVYLAFFASCIGPVFWTMISEIFPNKVRGSAMAWPVFTQWLFNAIMVLFFPHFHHEFPAQTFTIIGVLALLQFLFTLRFVPETKGKSLEEIEKIWGI
jgi:MFS transporter, SP family, arabinose:H+ symporter